MDRYSPIRTFLDRLTTEGRPLNMSKKTKHWEIHATSNTRDWAGLDIYDTDGELPDHVFSGSIDFWTKELEIESAQDDRVKTVVISTLKGFYPDLTTKERA